MLKIEKIIAIQNYGTSGTTLMHSLLDDHPKIISLPYLYGLYLFGLWNQIAASGNFSKEHVFEVIKSNLRVLFNVDYSGEPSLAQMGESKNERVEVNEEEFFSHMRNYFEGVDVVTRKQFIISIYVAYNLCYGRSFSDDAIISFSFHSQDKAYVGYLTQDFAQVYFLHMIREPVQNIGSIAKHIQYSSITISLFKSLLNCSVSQIALERMEHWSNGYIEVYGKRPYAPDFSDGGRFLVSKAVRLEDVHKNPNYTLQKICDWVGISWDNCLLKSTFMGRLWHNRPESPRVSGINNVITGQKYNKFLNLFDHYRLKLLTKTEQKYFGYYSFTALDHLFFRTIFPLTLLIPFKVDFNKKRLQDRVGKVLGEHCGDRIPQNIKDWVMVNFSRDNYQDKLSAVFKDFYNIETHNGIKEWIKNNGINNIAWTNKTLTLTFDDFKKFRKNEKVKAFFKYLPFILQRAFLNYFNLRKKMLQIWLERLTKDDSDTYVKMLYDLKEIKK